MPGFNVNLSDANAPDNRIETHRVHRWEVDFGFPNSIISGTRTNNANLAVYAKTCSLPTVGFDIGKAPGAAIDYPYASKVTFEPVTISFYDVFQMYPLFDKWRDAIWTKEDGIKMINDYAGNPKITKRDGNGNKTQEFTLMNAFPKSISHTELTYDSSEILLVKVTFVYSHFEFNELSNSAVGFE